MEKNIYAAFNLNLNQIKTATNSRNGPETRLKISATMMPAMLLMEPTITDMTKKQLKW
ncbi:hypothetical protein [uncultured Nostoc sp.]|uniref:hypothetical protein n=1 Tax=uncultured Nostoc sp. TaxID=340711 RepID=UPI00345A7DAF